MLVRVGEGRVMVVHLVTVVVEQGIWEEMQEQAAERMLAGVSNVIESSRLLA